MRTGHQTERFPQSAVLFKFCMAVLQKRQRSTKVNDQDLGNILKYNASDTSHWKHGKKSVKSVHALEALAKHLNTDFETLHDLSDGTLDFDEAWFEFSETESLKDLAAKISPEMRRIRAEHTIVLEDLATRILAKADITSIPVFIPEVVTALPFLEVITRDVGDKLARSTRTKPGAYSIRYRKGDMRAHTRVAIIHEISRIILHSERQKFGLPPRIDELLPFEIELLSNALLVPLNLLKFEFQKVSVRLDVTTALADTFWVPKSVIRSRLAQALTQTLSHDATEFEKFVTNTHAPLVTHENLDLSEDELDDVAFGKSSGQTLASIN